MTTDTTTTIKTPGTPKPWMNSAMTAVLKMPGLRRIMGKSFAVMTVTGAKSGRRYSTPVQYFGHDGQYLVLSQRTRRWWRNIATNPQVELLIQGEPVAATATIADDESARDLLAVCLRRNPRVAKFYGLWRADTKTVDVSLIGELLERMVVIIIEPGR